MLDVSKALFVTVCHPLCSTKDPKYAENDESITYVNHMNKKSAITVRSVNEISTME